VTIAYIAVRIFDGTSYVAHDGGALVVEGERIVSAGPGRDVPDGAEIFDLGDATLMPGLVDAHVHLIWDSSAAPEERVARESGAMTALRAAANAARHLHAGVTTVRDLGSTGGLAVELARSIEQGVADGPRVIAAGRAITMTGGHVFQIGHEADGPDGVRRAVREELKAGAGCVKFMASGGVMGGHGEEPGAPQLTAEEMRAGVEEAHKAGRAAAAHAYSVEAINNALDAGVDSIEHGSFLDLPTAERMRAEGVYLVPTLSTIKAVYERGPELGVPDHARRKIAGLLEASDEAFRWALQAGVRVAAGSDAGVPGQSHGALTEELISMVEHGATPQQALRAGTLAAAGLLNVSGEAGVLQPGRRADIVAVSADPLRDIRAMRDVKLVVQGGREIRPPRGNGYAGASSAGGGGR